jgi:CTP:phosphocholine cytidylyltransferase-like protein/predicted transcriptional regulator
MIILKENKNLYKSVCVNKNDTISDAIKSLESSHLKIVLVTDIVGKFIGTISDGDIRRGLIRGLSLNENVVKIINTGALVLPPGMDPTIVNQVMESNQILQIPAIDDENNIVGLYLWGGLNKYTELDNLFVIMAGGLGTRLKPYTESCPKPLIRISGKPMLEHILVKARNEGFNKFVISIHHLGDMVKEYFGYGEKLGITIEYLEEKSPLGTIGALSLINTNNGKPILVTNCDVVSDIAYSEVIDFHVNQAAQATMVVRAHEWQNPFGVVHIEEDRIMRIYEKTITKNYINAGIYLFNSSILNLLKKGERQDVPNFFEKLLQNNIKVE